MDSVVAEREPEASAWLAAEKWSGSETSAKLRRWVDWMRATAPPSAKAAAMWEAVILSGNSVMARTS